jgi:hypothetical protein
MRYFVGFLCVCALGVVPQSASAQDAQEGSSGSWQVQYEPSPSRAELKEMDLRVKRAAIGMGVSAGSAAAGGVLALAGFGHCGGIVGPWTEKCNRLTWSGVAIASAGVVALISTGILYGVRQRKRQKLLRHYHPIRIPTHWDEHSYAPPRRLHWDLAQSGLVF